MVGLAGTIVAVISSASLSDKPSLRQLEEAAPVAARREAPEAEAPKVGRQASAAAPAPAAPPRVVAAVKLAMTEAATPPDLGGWDATRVAAAPSAGGGAATLPAAPGETPHAALLAAARTRALDEVAPETPSLWADAAVRCPRDWVAGQGAEPSGDAAVDCGATAMELPAPAPLPPVVAAPPVTETPPDAAMLAALPPVAAPLVGEPALDEGAVDPAGQEAVAPAPRARPEPPPDAVKKPARVRTAAKGRLPPPPNCGEKHAYWRYVEKKPVWYCR